MRQRLYLMLEAGKVGDAASRIFDIFMVVLILANVAAFAAETEPSLAAAYGRQFELFNAVSIVIFTIEYALRLWVCVGHPPLGGWPRWRARLRWAATPPMLVDLLVILPFYLSVLLPVDLRVLRLVRFVRLARFSPALGTLGRVLYNERRAIFGALIVMVGLLVCTASLMYVLERHAQPEAFGSVPRAMWWALETLTTVGYGDAVPVTPLGKLVGGLVMIFGLGMFALPIAIIASGFSREIHRHEFVVTWGMVARVPLFSGLDAFTIGNLVQLLDAQMVEAGSILGRKGEEATGMYFIVSGQVQIEFASGPVLLGEGEFFGEMALLDARRRAVDIMALTRCTLLKLESSDFTRFTRRYPDVRKKIAEVAQTRLHELRKRSEAETELAEIRLEKETKPGQPLES